MIAARELAVVLGLVAAGAGVHFPGLAAAQQGIGQVASVVRGAWASQRASGVVGQGTRILVQLPEGPARATVGRDQAIRLLDGLFRRAEEIEVTVASSREVEPGQGYVELRRRFRQAGRGDEQVQRVLLAYRREGDRGVWSLVELRVLGARN